MSEQHYSGQGADEQEIRNLESCFPLMSDRAFSAESQRSLDAGLTVTQAVGNQVFRISPDGSRQMVKTLPEPHPVQGGSRILIR